MKTNYLIAVLLLISIHSQSNNLTIHKNDTRFFSNSSIILLDDIIIPNNGNFSKNPNNIEINFPFQQVISDSLCSVSKDGVRFSYDFKMRYTSDKNYVASLQTKNDFNDSVFPEILEILNGIFGQYSIGEIYSFKRKEIEILILNKLRSRFEEDHIKVDAILFVNIQFSEKIKKEIEERLRREHQKNKSINNNG